MVNIRQLTNYDLKNASTVTKYFPKAGQTASRSYYVITQSMLGAPVSKMGYCCETKGIAYPVYLTINGIETEFQIGKTGMFEFQEETWRNINGDNIERTAEVFCTEVKVPVDIKFTLDYCYTV